MTRHLIFEIGCEELPASFVSLALEQLKEEFVRRAAQARLEIQGVRVLGTPRRLTLIVEKVAATQQDLEEERTGPPARAAYRDGEPTKAALGFARGQGVEPEALYLVETEKGEYVAAKVFEPGRPAGELLPGIVQGALEALSFPKSMRWGQGREQFARPVRWLLALLDDQVLPVSYAGVTSDRFTYGHRFASPGAIEVTQGGLYEELLSGAQVEVDPDKRRDAIMALARQAAESMGAELIEDDELLGEVVQLVEKPHAVLVTYDEAYLELPDEVLLSSMRSHQRYFAVRQAGALTHACVVIYNTPVRDPEVVRAGNLRVLRARLDDATFFWRQDLKRPLEAALEELGEVIWLKQLGSVKQRALRMSALAAKLAERLELSNEHVDAASRAAYLSKADLVSQMVNEFPDLQGVMGREYALRSGESEEVAKAIAEQYLPRGAEDELPGTHAGAIVALSERLDALAGLFGVGLTPKGNADPYALRRAALGVLRIVQDRAYALTIEELVTAAVEVYEERAQTQSWTSSSEEVIGELHDFVLTRQRHLLAADFRTDLVDAVVAVAAGDILSVKDRVQALAELQKEDDFGPLAAGYKRVVNILRKHGEEPGAEALTGEVDVVLLEELQERELYAQSLRAREHVEGALQTRDWASACKALITLKRPIDDFFDHVMVMAEDHTIRHNRLELLARVSELFSQVADLSRVQA